ncbi:MAG: hypothetical protein EBR01_15055 [Proteobacteria bacterium]|nr:hypothetical protein [Pseudomonadota bacterium]
MPSKFRLTKLFKSIFEIGMRNDSTVQSSQISELLPLGFGSKKSGHLFLRAFSPKFLEIFGLFISLAR